MGLVGLFGSGRGLNINELFLVKLIYSRVIKEYLGLYDSYHVIATKLISSEAIQC